MPSTAFSMGIVQACRNPANKDDNQLDIGVLDSGMAEACDGELRD